MPENLLVRKARPDDLAAISDLHARVFGPGRFTRTAYRVREGVADLSKFCHVGFLNDQLVAALNFTQIEIGTQSGALLLGPFVVEPDVSKKGLGAALMEKALQEVSDAGVPLVILVGDEPFYSRFGFVQVPPRQITFPGPVDPGRILALEKTNGVLEKYHGKIAAQH